MWSVNKLQLYLSDSRCKGMKDVAPLSKPGDKRLKKGQKKTKRDKNFRFCPQNIQKGCPNGQPCTLKVFGFIRSHVVYKLFSTNSNIRVTITKESGQPFQSQETYLDSFQRFKEPVMRPTKKVRNYKSLTSSIVKPVMSDIISNAKP